VTKSLERGHTSNEMTKRKYKFPTLAAYFEHQKSDYDGIGASRYTTDKSCDTHARLAERMNVSEKTISRIVVGLADPSFRLALRISRDVDCPPDGMGWSGMVSAERWPVYAHGDNRRLS